MIINLDYSLSWLGALCRLGIDNSSRRLEHCLVRGLFEFVSFLCRWGESGAVNMTELESTPRLSLMGDFHPFLRMKLSVVADQAAAYVCALSKQDFTHFSSAMG
jgi:hypothetical protein